MERCLGEQNTKHRETLPSGAEHGPDREGAAGLESLTRESTPSAMWPLELPLQTELPMSLKARSHQHIIY